MKKTLIALLGLFIFLSACSGNAHVEVDDYDTQPERVSEDYQGSYNISVSLLPLTFEQSLRYSATDVVIVQYVGRRQFNATEATELEFIVVDRILGNAADRIFVYAADSSVFLVRDLGFRPGADYILVLHHDPWPYTTMHIDNYTIIRNAVIDLDNPANSLMYRNYLYIRSDDDLDLGADGLTRYDIINHIEAIIRDRDRPPRGDMLIRSDATEDIVLGSPNVMVIQIDRPRVLSHQLESTDWTYHDVFFATVIDSLSGDIPVGTEVGITFHANTVNTGEQHIVATRVTSGGWHDFTSRDSLFHMDQLEEIKQILDQEPPPPPQFTLTFNLHGGEPQSNFPPQTIAAGTTATEPLYTPTRNGYNFTGWFTDATGGTAFDFATPIYTDTTVHAQWETIPLTPFTLTLDPRGGTVGTSTITVPQGSPVGPLPNPVLSGREFAGWYYMPEVGERERILPTTVLDRDITASAVWHVTITLDPMGGVFGNCVMRGTPLLPFGEYEYLPLEAYSMMGGLHIFTAEPGTQFDWQLLTPQFDARFFMGWFTTRLPGAVDERIDESSIIPDSNITLYARWGRGF